jgi:hypothetical protein
MGRAAVLFPAFVATLLSLPCLGFTYLGDDYLFLNNALTANLRDWLPRAGDAFYRPISRALYFAVVAPFGMPGALFAHLLNLVYLMIAATGLALLARQIRGWSFGLLAGVMFAGMAGIPVLVGWASCSQDLLAIDFVLLALLARSRGRDGLAILSFAAALLSKETALAMAPALVAWDWIVNRRGRGLARQAAIYACVVIAWAAIHPAVRVLLSRRLAPGATGYLGLTDPGTWLRYLGRYLSVLTNLRLGRFDPTWPGATTIYLVLTALAAALGLWSLTRGGPDETHATTGVAAEANAAGEGREEKRPDARRVALLGLFLAAPPLLLTSTIISSWAPYYAAFPMIGLSLLGAQILERVGPVPRTAAVALYLLLGIWARGSDLDSLHITERQLRPSSHAMRQVEAEFRKLAPRLPSHTDVVMSIQASGTPRVYAQMYYEPIRLWYQDQTLHLVKPIKYRPTGRAMLLAVITADLDVVFIDLDTFATHSAKGRTPDYLTCEKALRALAVGLGGAGHAEQGAALLLQIPNVDADSKSIHWRTAAMLLDATGERARADSLIAAAPPMERWVSLINLHGILAEQPPGLILDDAALHAYGIRPDDVAALRDLASWLSRFGYAEPARRLASRLLALAPRDSTGLRALAVADSVLAEQRDWPVELR